jgi:hypothetical protein
MGDFEVIGEVARIEVIAVNVSIRERRTASALWRSSLEKAEGGGASPVP